MKYGEIVQLGRHRLMCGDATKAEDVSALVASGQSTPNHSGLPTINLVLTDPPYGIKCRGGYYRFRGGWVKTDELIKREQQRYSQPHYKSIIGDDSQDTARKHYQLVSLLTDRLIFWGGQYFANFLPTNKGWLIWSKHQALPNHSDAELAWSSLPTNTKVYDYTWNGAVRKGSRKLNPTPSLHPTQKPVELHAHILEDFTQPGDVILDCFGGSGTTLIACEITERTCLMMELSPEYCDIIINRYNTLTEGTINYEYHSH